jgi:hypothetical protein
MLLKMMSSLTFSEMEQIVGRGNGEDTLAHWPTSSGIMTVEDAFHLILQYLDKIWGTISFSGSTKCGMLVYAYICQLSLILIIRSKISYFFNWDALFAILVD